MRAAGFSEPEGVPDQRFASAMVATVCARNSAADAHFSAAVGGIGIGGGVGGRRGGRKLLRLSSPSRVVVDEV